MLGLDIRNTIKRLLGPVLAKPINIAWLYRVFIRSRKAKTEFEDLQAYWDYNLQFNSQTLSMEARLNQQYNMVMGSIYIVTQNSANDAVYAFWINENQPAPYIYFLAEGNTPTYITWLGEGSASAADFIVYVPISLIFDENEMRAIIDLYRLAGKRYSVILY